MTRLLEAVPVRRAGGFIRRAHGGGGTAMNELLERHVFARLGDARLAARGDSAIWTEPALATAVAAGGARLAFTTDAFVVTPLEFPGGDIGRIAVCGTVNDLAVAGARPVALSLALVLEEGLPIETLDRVVESAARAADEAGVGIATGDTKVIDRRPGGGAPGLFATTAGVGVVPAGRDLAASKIRPGDAILVTGPIADHGVAVMATREGLDVGDEVRSDAEPLNGLVEALLAAAPGTRFLRDATRGGLAAVLCEAARAAGAALEVDESAIPVRPATAAALAILGLDPLAVANEGVVVAFVPSPEADAALAAIRAHRNGRGAARIGEVAIADAARAGRVVLRTAVGGRRVVVPPYGEELPRIC